MFDTTLWSRIADAQRGSPSAIEGLVNRYREPLIRYFRSKGCGAADAEDLVQEVLLRLFTRDALVRADRERGRFRAYLLGVGRNVLREEQARRAAKKRGGGTHHVPIDTLPDLPAEEPDEGFDRLWAEQLLAGAVEELRVENPRQHATLVLRFEESASPTEIAARLGRSVQQVNNDIHRARKRLSKLVRAEITRYASSRDEFEDDLNLFLGLVGLR